mmetsp:Transcript_60189/g.148004  ORF Transcript_60189/g.148004 Transcript_60189/m.148004 type:complete len:638 (-) Transcript_60189:3556-5469(-)
MNLVEAVVDVRHGDGLGGLLVVPLAPERLVARDNVRELLEEWDRHGKLDDVEPHAVGDPLFRLLLDGVDVERGSALDEALEVVHRDHIAVELQLERQQQRVDLLVDLHVPAAHVQEGAERQLVDDVGDALGGDGRLLGVVHGEAEDLHELRERRLVHRVDSAHLSDEEVDNGAARRHGAVLLARRLDAELRLPGVLELLLHLGRRLLGDVEHVDDLGVVKQRPRAVGEAEEQVVLQLQDLGRVVVHLRLELRPLRLELGLLVLHDAVEELILETLHRHGEVDDGDLGAQLGGKVGVGEAGGDVELELLGLHVALLVGEGNDEALALALERLVKHGVEHGVELVLDVGEQKGPAVAHAVLQELAEGLVVEASLLAVVLGLHVLDPLEPLPLRVDHDRIARRARRQDAVLRREIVCGEALEVPLARRRLVREHLRDVEALGHGDLLCDKIVEKPGAKEEVAESLVEGPCVRHEPAGDGAVAREARDLVGEVSALLRPAVALAGEAVDELRGGVHLALGGVGLVLQALLLGHGRVELELHRIELRLRGRQLRLSARKLLHGRRQLSLLEAQRVHLGDHHLGDGVVRHHGLDPLAQPDSEPRRLGGGLDGEEGVLDVGEQELAVLVGDALLGEALQVHEEC